VRDTAVTVTFAGCGDAFGGGRCEKEITARRIVRTHLSADISPIRTRPAPTTAWSCGC